VLVGEMAVRRCARSSTLSSYQVKPSAHHSDHADGEYLPYGGVDTIHLDVELQFSNSIKINVNGALFKYHTRKAFSSCGKARYRNFDLMRSYIAQS